MGILITREGNKPDATFSVNLMDKGRPIHTAPIFTEDGSRATPLSEVTERHLVEAFRELRKSYMTELSEAENMDFWHGAVFNTKGQYWA